LAQAPTRKALRANDCMFDSTMTAHVVASLHYLEAQVRSFQKQAATQA